MLNSLSRRGFRPPVRMTDTEPTNYWKLQVFNNGLRLEAYYLPSNKKLELYLYDSRTKMVIAKKVHYIRSLVQSQSVIKRVNQFIEETSEMFKHKFRCI